MKRGLDDKIWAAIRADYISGDDSLRHLAAKYGISTSTIMRRSQLDKWSCKREQFRSKTEADLADRLANQEAADAALKLLAIKRSADCMANVISKTMEDADQFHRYIVSDGIGGGATETEERIYQKVDTKAIKDLTGAIKDLTSIMRNLYDLPTIQERAAMQNAADRLNLEKKNAEKAETDSAAGVRVEFVDLTEDMSE